MADKNRKQTLALTTMSRGSGRSDEDPFDTDNTLSSSDSETEYDREYDPSETSSDRAYIALTSDEDQSEQGGAEQEDEEPEDEEQDPRGTRLIQHDAVPVPRVVVRKRAVKVPGQPAFVQYLVQGEWWVTPRYGNEIDALIAAFEKTHKDRSSAPTPN